MLNDIQILLIITNNYYQHFQCTQQCTCTYNIRWTWIWQHKTHSSCRNENKRFYLNIPLRWNINNSNVILKSQYNRKFNSVLMYSPQPPADNLVSVWRCWRCPAQWRSRQSWHDDTYSILSERKSCFSSQGKYMMLLCFLDSLNILSNILWATSHQYRSLPSFRYSNLSEIKTLKSRRNQVSPPLYSP